VIINDLDLKRASDWCKDDDIDREMTRRIDIFEYLKKARESSVCVRVGRALKMRAQGRTSSRARGSFPTPQV
jgi:hypothetical protein